MKPRRSAKVELRNCLKGALISVGLVLGGGLMFVLSTATGRVYPIVALFAGGMVLFGGLGLLIAVVTLPYWISKARTERADVLRRAADPSAWYFERPQFDLNAPFRPEPGSPLPIQHQIWIYEDQIERRRNAPSTSAPASRQASPVRQTPAPRRAVLPQPATLSTPIVSPSQPAPPPPAPRSQALSAAESEQPTIAPPRSPVLGKTYTDYTAPSPFDYVAPTEDYSTWTTETLRDRLSGLDSAAMRLALHAGGVPDGMAQEMNAIKAELSRRGAGR